MCLNCLFITLKLLYRNGFTTLARKGLNLFSSFTHYFSSFPVIFANCLASCQKMSLASQIPLARYLPTWRGNVIDAEMEMNPSRVVGMSLSVNAEGGVPGAKSGPGDFRVEVDWIKALRSELPVQ